MASSVQYAIVDVPLDAVTGKVPIVGTQGADIRGVFFQPSAAGGLAVPVGADVLLFFGAQDGVLVSSVYTGFNFECGLTDGIYYQNRVALAAGTVLRLLISYGGLQGVSV